MVFRLYDSRETSDGTGLPIGLRGLVDRKPALEKGSLIGDFPSEEAALQYIQTKINQRGGTNINISAPKGEQWISVDFRNSEAQQENLNYFLE